MSKFSKVKFFFQSFFNKKQPLQAKSQNKISSSSNLVVEKTIENNMNSFAKKTLEDIMIPRSDIIAAPVNSSIEDLNKLIIEHGHTRILIYKERIDDIIGFIHIKDLFPKMLESKKFDLKSLIRKHIVSTDSMRLVDLFAQMQRNRIHIAIIVDEYGCTDGLVTMENIIEQIVGEIDDEHDDIDEDENCKILQKGVIVVNARFAISELEDLIKRSLPRLNDEFDTIGGLIIAQSGNVPEKGDIIKITDDIVAEILESTPRNIKQIKITYTDPSE